MNQQLYKHSSGALVWFPSGYTYQGNVGVVVKAAHPWKLHETYNHWFDLEPTDLKLELTIIEP